MHTYTHTHTHHNLVYNNRKVKNRLYCDAVKSAHINICVEDGVGGVICVLY